MRCVSKHFGGTHALIDAGIDVGAGEIVALLGENGAGKSTLIKILAGVHPLDAGAISYRGHDATHTLRRLPIAFIHQDLGLIEWMTVAENISLMLGFPRRFGLINWGAARTRAEDALNVVGADIDPDLRIHHLTRTEKSLVAILLIVGREPSQVFKRPARQQGGARLLFEQLTTEDAGPFDCRMRAGEVV